MKRLLKCVLNQCGYDIVKQTKKMPRESRFKDVTDKEHEILDAISPFTMTSMERRISLIRSVEYLVRYGIGGCFVECGVWRGGSVMAMVLTLLQSGADSRPIYLYDTFSGMTPPTDKDRTGDGVSAETHLLDDPERSGNVWAVSTVEEVRGNIETTGYPTSLVHYIEGAVEQTLPDHCPAEPIALLRLDTDWYQSTRHELMHLVPRVVDGGIIIIDDYGTWQGAKKATDEYFSAGHTPWFFHRIDAPGRLLVKQASADTSEQ